MTRAKRWGVAAVFGAALIGCGEDPSRDTACQAQTSVGIMTFTEIAPYPNAPGYHALTLTFQPNNTDDLPQLGLAHDGDQLTMTSKIVAAMCLEENNLQPGTQLAGQITRMQAGCTPQVLVEIPNLQPAACASF